MNSRNHLRLVVVSAGLIMMATFTSLRSSAAENPPVAIKIDNFSFGPQTLTVAAGTEVTWTNQDDIPHTVVSDDKTTIKSKALDTDDKFTFKFTIIHMEMRWIMLAWSKVHSNNNP